ncbi:MAG TPA: efflux transporter outer membrane subunit [Bryobacteraceae bacterium]|nr:efflux transporter outer membrane subunit [Bryobacteraceae bacterium]
MRWAIGLAASLILLASCTVGPNYKRPVANVPAVYRGEAASEPGNQAANSLGDEKWWTVFQDPELQNLIRMALKQNYDLRIAATRILQAQAQVVIARAGQFPNASVGPSVSGVRSPGIPGVFKSYSYLADELTLSGSWNIDFWGRYRRATEAARASLRASEWGRRAVIGTLVENLAAAYFQLREIDLELSIAKRTLGSRQQSLKLATTLEQGGATSMVDVRQSQQLVEEAAETIPDTERLAQQTENQISILLGENPTAIPRGRPITEQPLPQTIPAGLPSRLLERRPDIRQAEQQLIAANAEIGVARAQLFPQISLTGSGGVESIGLGNLLTWAARYWNWSGTATQPIFNAGSLRANVRLAKAQQQQLLLTYQQTIQTAFREVSDSLIAYQKYREFRQHQQALTAAAQDAAHLSEIRYQGGVASYLEVLTNETTYFTAELNLARAELNERLSLVQVYNALGGGWEQ